jgi:hypothetical protein
METPAPTRLQKYRAFWRRADAYMSRQEASFAALVVGPVKIAAGVSIGSSVGVPGGFAGTLGGTVEAGTKSVALTAGHVVSSGDNSGRAEQPAAGFGDPQTEIGRVIGWSELVGRRNRADLGVIRLHSACDNGQRSTFSELGPQDLAELRVRKTGATTGTTSGHVALVGTKGIPVFHYGRRKFFDGLFGITGDSGQEFAGLGDSGAFVYPADPPSGGDAAVGMVVAVSIGYKGIDQPVCWAVGSTAMSASLGKILRDGSRTEA